MQMELFSRSEKNKNGEHYSDPKCRIQNQIFHADTHISHSLATNILNILKLKSSSVTNAYSVLNYSYYRYINIMRFNNQAYFILYNIKFKLFSDYSLTFMLKTGLVIEAKIHNGIHIIKGNI